MPVIKTIRPAWILALLLAPNLLRAWQSPLSFQPLSNPLATFGLPYAASLQAVGGTPPYRYQLAVGSAALPPGVSLSTTGNFSGAPTAEGFFRFNVTVSDAANASSSAEILVAVNPPWNPVPLPDAVVGQPYSASVLLPGLLVPYPVQQQSGFIPAGLQLSSNGVISGTPTAAPGSYSFVVRSSVTPTTIAARTINVSSNPTSGVNPPDLVGGQLPDARRGLIYSYQFQASGGVPPYRFSLAQGALPPGVGLQDSGSLSGVPGLAGTYPFRVRATGFNGSATEAGYILRVVEPNITLPGGELPPATISRPYTTQITAVGGTAPIRYLLLGSVLPPNLQFEQSGRISGTPNTGGTFDLLVQAIDANNESATGRYALRIVRPDFRITDSRLPAGRRGESYSHVLRTADGTAPYTFFLTQGSALPQGLTLSPSGTITGTPLVAGDFNFSVTAVDAQAYSTTSTLTLNIAAARLSILTTALPAPVLGQSYRQTIQVSGGADPLRFTILAGVLPPGLSLVASTGTFEGTPTTAGTFTFLLRAIDGASQVVDQSYTVRVDAPQPLSISASNLSVPALHASYQDRIQPQGGNPPYTFRLLEGTLPPGVQLEANGAFRGAPLQAGTFAFTAQVTDASSAQASLRVVWAITTPLLLPTASTARDYSVAISSLLPAASLPSAPWEFDPASIMALPAGLSLDGSGRLSGRPTAPGLYAFSLRAGAARYAVSLPVEGSGFRIRTTALPPARVGRAYSFNLSAESGQGFLRWRLRESSLPPGMVLDPIVGRLEGTPEATGVFPFTAEALDADSRSATRSFVFTVGPANLPLLTAVTNAASYAAEGVAPGEVLTLFGEPLGPDARILFDGVPSPMIYSLATQSSAVAPFRLSEREFTSVAVQRGGQSSLPWLIQVLPAKPGIFTLNGSGRGTAAALNENGSVNSEANPASPGSIVVLYATGGGAMTPPGSDGQAATGISSLNLPVRVEINGQSATVQYAGNAPGLLQGVIQVNVQLPAALPRGANSVVLIVGTARSASGVTIWVN